MNTDLAKKWLEDNEYTGTTTVGMVTAFAKYLDEREVMENGCACRGRYTKLWATHSKTKCSESDEPRKEDKPVCEKCGCSDCPFVRIRERMIEKCQPKPEPIEELYKDRVVIPEHEIMGDLVRKLNEVIRRLNTISHE